MDGLVVGQMDGMTDELVDIQLDGMMDRLFAQQTDMMMDGHWWRQEDRQSSGVGRARWGHEATGSFRRVGGPLDRGRRGLGNVES